MHPLERHILDLCRAHPLLLPGERLVVGVSGGPDSIALLRVLHALSPALDLTMTVAHLDHGLRPEDGPKEEALVRRAAAELGIKCLVRRADTAAHAKRHRLSLEEAARELRYAFFEETRAADNACKIAVGHTKDDQAEEVLIRLIRGAGRRGLAGMSPLRDGLVIRPFLDVAKQDLLRYLKEQEAEFALDPSNSDRRYLRNRVRHDLLPYLARFNPNIKDVLHQEAEVLRDEDALLDAQTRRDYPLVARERTIDDHPAVILDRVGLTARPIAIQRRIVEMMLINLGQRPGFRQIEAILRLAGDRGRGRSLHLARGLRLDREGPELICRYPQGQRRWRGEADVSTPFQYLLPGPGHYLLPEAGLAITVETLATLPDPSEMRRGEADFLDARQATFPLVARSRREGDIFHPLNSPGRRKVSDFLTDRKLSRSEKAKVPVITSGGRIVALAGKRIDHQARITDASRQTIKICLFTV